MEIRAIDLAEMDAVIELHLQGLKLELDFFNAIVPHKSVDIAGITQLKQILIRIVQTGEGMIFVAKDAATYAGYILVTKKIYPVENPKTVGCINGIFVREEFRRLAAGRKLVDEALAWLRRSAVHYLELYHMINDPRAQAFWQAIGLKPVQLNCAMVI